MPTSPYDTDDFLEKGPASGGTTTVVAASASVVVKNRGGVPSGAPIPSAAVVVPEPDPDLTRELLLHLSAAETSCLYKDFARTMLAANFDSVLGWEQVDEAADDDVFDNASSGPAYRASAPSVAPAGELLSQNAHDNTTTLKTPMPSGANPWFVGVAIELISSNVDGGVLAWGVPPANGVQLNHFRDSGDSFAGKYKLVYNATTIESDSHGANYGGLAPSIVFVWYDGDSLYMKLNSDAVKSSAPVTLNVTSSGDRSEGIELFDHAQVADSRAYMHAFRAYGRALTETERGLLFDEWNTTFSLGL